MLKQLGINAKNAARHLAVTDTETKNKALLAAADALEAEMETIIASNSIDLEYGKQAGLSASLLDRLMLNPSRIRGLADGIREVIALPDPVGRVLSESVRPNGLRITKVSVPIGVIAVIYEARPNVTSDAAALCLKSGNACILRGGKEAINSNIAISGIMRKAIEKAGLVPDCIQLVSDTSRDSAVALMKLNGYVDVLIPRGSAGLIKSVVENSTLPVIETGSGVCHIYVDKAADPGMAASIVFNAKTSRPSVCNAAECMLIHEDIAGKALPLIAAELKRKNVEIRGDRRVCEIVKEAIPASENDWGCEFLDYIIAAKVVKDIDEALEHIYKYGTRHSECIVTGDKDAAEYFLKNTDAAAVYHNASTRFTDGGEFGLGAEIGISTQKLHARGPLGLNELTSMKFIIGGSGQVR
jgi:glutamate-5-semialdehyde dehydrogenase